MKIVFVVIRHGYVTSEVYFTTSGNPDAYTIAPQPARSYHVCGDRHKHGRLTIMTAIQRSIAIARRRLLLQGWLTRLGWALVAATALVVAALVADRLFALMLSLWVYLPLVAVPVLLSPIVALWRRPGIDQTATMIDQRLALKDRIATALYASQLEDDAFADHVVAEAEEAAAKAPVARAFDVRLTWIWAYVPVALVLLLLVWLVLPQWDLAGLQRARDRRARERAEAEAAREELTDLAERTRKIDQQRKQPGESDAAESIGKLAELSDKQLNNPKLRRDAAAKLAKAADKLDEEVDKKQREQDAVKNMLSRLETTTTGPANRLVHSLRRGDFESASDALDSAVESAESMSPDEKEQLARQLDDLSKDLEKESKRQAEQQKAAQKETEEKLEQSGLSKKQIEELDKDGYEKKAVEEALRKSGADPQKAEQTAKEVQKKQQDKRQAGDCAKSSGGLSSSLGKMSQTLADSAKKGKQGEGRQSVPSDAKQPGDKQPKAGRQGGKGAGAESAEQDKSSASSGKSGGEKTGGKDASKSGQSSGEKTGGEDASKSGKSGGEKTDAQGGSQPGKSDGGKASPGKGSKQGGQGGASMQQAADKARQQLDQLADSQRQLQQLRQSRDQTRQAMRKMADSPTAGAGGSQWGKAPGHAPMAAPSGKVTGKTHAVGVPPKAGPTGEVVASWSNDGKIAKGEAHVEFDQMVTSARREAEQAIAEDRVPKRYHRPVQKYFAPDNAENKPQSAAE